MTALTTNEWIEYKKGMFMLKDREVLVQLSDDTLRTLIWDGYRWIDPKTRIRQFFFDDSIHVVQVYIFEKPPKRKKPLNTNQS